MERFKRVLLTKGETVAIFQINLWIMAGSNIATGLQLLNSDLNIYDSMLNNNVNSKFLSSITEKNNKYCQIV